MIKLSGRCIMKRHTDCDGITSMGPACECECHDDAADVEWERADRIIDRERGA